MPVDRHGRSGSFLLPGTSTDPWGQLLWPVTVAGVPAIEIHCMADVVSIRKAWRKKWKSIKQTTIKRMKQTKGTRAHILILDTSIYNWEQICYRSSLVYPQKKQTHPGRIVWITELNLLDKFPMAAPASMVFPFFAPGSPVLIARHVWSRSHGFYLPPPQT